MNVILFIFCLLLAFVLSETLKAHFKETNDKLDKVLKKEDKL